MTAVIGFAIQDGVVIATDSQSSDTEAGMKQCDSKKLFKVDFKGGSSALLGRSGSIAGADIFQDVFETLAAETEVTDSRTIARIAEKALVEARAKIANARDPSLSKKETQDHFRSFAHGLILAYVFKGERFIFHGEATSALLVRLKHPYVAIGSGNTTARLVLDGMDPLSMDKRRGLGLAAYTIEMCKRADLYCQGPVQLGWVDMDGRTEIVENDVRNLMQQAAETTYRNICTRLANEIGWNFTEVFGPYVDAKLAETENRLRELRGGVGRGRVWTWGKTKL